MLTQAVLTAALTLLGGCGLFIFSQAVNEGIIKPYLDYQKVLADITYTLVYYANVIVSAPAGSKPDEHAQISEKLRQLSARLRSSFMAIRCQALLRKLQLLPAQYQIQDAAGRLIRISNRLLDSQKKEHDEIYEDMKAIGPLLRIDVASG